MARTHSFAVTGPLTDFYVPPARFARFAPWQGIFLAGAYTGDLDTAFNASLWQLGWIAAVILTATLLLAWLINRDITGALGGLKPAMERLAQGDLRSPSPAPTAPTGWAAWPGRCSCSRRGSGSSGTESVFRRGKRTPFEG